MSKKPKYSIIIPTKDRAYCLWKAISSITAQTYKDWELLIVDGNSQDETEKLVYEFNDTRIKFIPHPKDTGVSSARNKGLSVAKGDLIGYLDSDDYVNKNWLKTMDRYITMHPKKVLFMPDKTFTIKLVNENNQTVKTYLETRLFKEESFSARNIINLKIQCDTNGMIHRKESVKKVGAWEESLSLYEDFDFLFRFIESYPDGLAFVRKVLVSYTRTYGKDSLCSNTNYENLIKNLDIVYELRKCTSIKGAFSWYPLLRKRFQELSDNEKKTGQGILAHIEEKYL